MKKRDLYEILGVAKDADADSIKSSYRKLAMKYHPDRASAEQKAEYESHFKECAEAYDVLSDEQKRARYDQFHAGGLHGPNLADIFGMPHWNNGNFPRRGADIAATVTISLKDILKETSRKVNIDTDEICQSCKGEGLKSGASKTQCRDCRGNGSVSNYFMNGNCRIEMKQGCGRCRGAGNTIAAENKCPDCNDGKVRITKEIEVRIPPGVIPDCHVRLQGLGRVGENGGPRGNAILQVNIEPDSKFHRIEEAPNDLSMELPISFVQSCLGDKIPVEMIDGSIVDITIPAHSPNGHTILVNGQGVPSLTNRYRGNLWIRLGVQVPTTLTEEQENLLRRFDEIERGKNVHKTINTRG